MARKDYEDDGRTIADMSGVERRPLFIPGELRRQNTHRTASKDEKPERDDSLHLTERERGAAIGGAWTAALAIGLVFIVCGALLIWLLTTVWR